MHCIRHHSFGPVEGYEFGFAPIGKPLKTVYIYRVHDAVIDTAQYHMRRYVWQALQGHKISAILMTHHHEDHSGNAEMLRKNLCAPVFAHPYAMEKLAKGFNILPYQHLLFGKSPITKISQLPAVIETKSICFIPIHTPGHSKDHTVYLEKNNGWLFSGDLFLGVKMQFFRIDEHIGDQINSLKKIMQLDFDALFCAHSPQPKNGKKLIAAKLQFLHDFLGEVGEHLNQGCSEKEIISQLQRKSDLAIRIFTMGNASFAHMVRSAIDEASMRITSLS